MSESTPESTSDVHDQIAPAAKPFWNDNGTRRWLASSAIVAIGLIAGGFLLGDGLVRAKEADRSVTVRGLA